MMVHWGDGNGDLTEREIEVLRLLADHSGKEIARLLCLSPHTVKNHRTRLYRKLRVQDRTSAVMAGLRKGLIGRREDGLEGSVDGTGERPPGVDAGVAVTPPGEVAVLFCRTCRRRTVHQPLGRMVDGHKHLELWGCLICRNSRVKWKHNEERRVYGDLAGESLPGNRDVLFWRR